MQFVIWTVRSEAEMGNSEKLPPELQRIVQELVPGKQISLAHIIANPDKVLYQKLGLDPKVDYVGSRKAGRARE